MATERDHSGFCMACGNLACCGDAERDRVREALADWKTRASVRTAVDCTEDDARAVVDCIAARLGIELSTEGT